MITIANGNHGGGVQLVKIGDEGWEVTREKVGPIMTHGDKVGRVSGSRGRKEEPRGGKKKFE